MPESEELKLSVSFVDNASAGLNKLRTDLDRLGGGDAANKVKKNLEEIGGGKHLEGFKKTGDHLENLRRQMVLFAEKGSGPLAEGLEKVSRMFLGVGRSGGIALGALGAVGGAMYAVQRTAVDFADKMEKLNEAARNTGLGMQQIKNLQNALRDSLIKPEEFDRYTNFVAKFSADIQKNSSQLTTYLRQVAGTNGAVMEQYIGHIRDLISKGLTGEAQTEILNLPIRMREEAIKSGKEITRATEEVKEAMRNMGFPESALRDFERVATASKTQEERLKGLSEETEKYNKKVAENGKLWGQVYDKLGEIAWAISKNPMNAMLDASKTLLEGMLHSFDAIEQKFKDFQHLKDTTGTAESKAEASPRKPEETPKQWLERTQTGGKSARQRLKESLDEQYKGMAPQQFASGGGDITANLPESSNIEDRRGEGDTRARLMDENTAELKKLNDYLTGQFARAAGGGVAGPAAVGLFSGGTGGGGGLGPGPGGGGAGGASFRGLGGLPGFPGGGGGGGGGAPGLAPGTGRRGSARGATSDSDPNMPSSTTGTGGDDSKGNTQASTIPGQFEADVKAMTLAGMKPHRIQQYIKSHGIDVSMATCGQFMSKVVKEHGGVPPKNPEVASNWNTFGEAGYSSDPNAINVAVKQGVRTGGTGSHVTAAVPIRDASGKITGFTGVGVNQGQGEGAERGVGQYGRDVISSHKIAIGTGRGQYQIRHYIPPHTEQANPTETAKATDTTDKPAGVGTIGGSAGESGGAGYLAKQRASMVKEMREHPETKKRLAALSSLEHESDPTAVVESLYNRTALVNEERAKRGKPPLSVDQMIGADRSKSFYGPVRSGIVPGRQAQLERDPARMKKMMDAIDAAASSNLVEGATDQGSGNDPNVGWQGGRVVRHGEVYNDWGALGHKTAQSFRERQQAGMKAAEERAAIDKEQVTHKVSGEASLDINVNAPAGTTLKQSHRGLFKRVRTNRQVQMAPAATGPVNSTAASIEE